MIRILIADDHTIVRKGIRQILAEEFTDAIIEEVADAEELIKSTFSPTMGVSIGMARVPRASHASGPSLKPGDAVAVDIRGKLISAQVVKMPFVRHGQVLV